MHNEVTVHAGAHLSNIISFAIIFIYLVNLYLQMFNHDDNMTDRSAESFLTKSEEETKRLWHDSYDGPMALNGAMYRGVSPAGKLQFMTSEEVRMKKWKKLKRSY